MKKILVIYGSVGLGHKVIAENIAHALEKQGVQVVKLDALQLYQGTLTSVSTKVYSFIIRYVPRIWGFLYTNRFFQSLSLPLRIPFARLKANKFRNFVETQKPDLILTTHPTATALALAMKSMKVFSGPVVTTFSDYHFQPFWVYKGVSHYLVMTEEQKGEILERGFGKNQITITGLPVDQSFLQRYDRAAVLKEFQLSGAPLVLVMGGSRSWGIKKTDLEAILGLTSKFQVAVLVGLNPEFRESLKKIQDREGGRFQVFGDLTQVAVAKLFSVAMVLVTKPGGLTIAQAVESALPMILVNPLPTMEEMNEEFLLSHGAAVSAKTSSKLAAALEKFLRDKVYYQSVKASLEKLRSPEAANIAAKTILEVLESLTAKK